MSISVDELQTEIPQALLDECASRHHHLCPRQVLGLRIGMLGCKLLGLDIPLWDKRLLVLAETDGCGADGIAVATGTSVGRRTLRVIDLGKVAATFVDTKTGEAIRVAPQAKVRERARDYAPNAPSRWYAYLDAYHVMLDSELLVARPVLLRSPIEEIIGKPGVRVNCEECGEEIINGREVFYDSKVMCRACAGESYYISLAG